MHRNLLTWTELCFTFFKAADRRFKTEQNWVINISSDNHHDWADKEEAGVCLQKTAPNRKSSLIAVSSVGGWHILEWSHHVCRNYSKHLCCCFFQDALRDRKGIKTDADEALSVKNDIFLPLVWWFAISFIMLAAVRPLRNHRQLQNVQNDTIKTYFHCARWCKDSQDVTRDGTICDFIADRNKKTTHYVDCCKFPLSG